MKRLLPLVFPLLFAACRGEGVSEYQEPKDSSSAVDAARAGRAQSGPAHAPGQDSRRSSLEWTDPAGWTRAPADGFRLASYRVKGADGEAELSVVVLPGEAGGVLANVERWRGQLGLPPLGSAAALAASSQKVSTKAGEAIFVDLQGPRARTAGGPSIPPNAAREENGPRARMLGAVLPRPGETWFLKMTGPEGAVGEARAAYLALLSGMRPAR
ncbi:MAG: hypothetical protein WC969_00270 [Elusimicrobiota bacterium]